MKHTRIAFAGVAIAALALAGCSSSPSDTATEEPAESGLLATVPDTLYGPVEIPEPEDGELTVVALGWSDAEVALALGVKPVAVADWMGFGGDGVGPWATDKFDGEHPELFENPFNGYDYEAIELLEPDLILNTRSAADEEQFKQLSAIAPTVYAPEGTPDFGTAWDVQTNQVAEALGLTEDGDKLITEVQKKISDAAEEHPEFGGVTGVSGTKFGDQYGAYIAGDFRWDLLADLGFEQNPAVLDLPAQGFYVPISVEQISALNADAGIFFPIGYTLDELLADPAISSLPMVQEKRVVFLEPDDEVTQAFSAASPLSIPIAVDGIVPQLADIVGR